MNKISAMIEAEARKAEAEHPDDAPPADADGSPQEDQSADPPSAPDPQPSIEAQLKAFEKENVRHETALKKLMGDDFEAFEPCPACATVGFRPTVEIQYDPDLEQCSFCKGHGILLTHAVREDRLVRECNDCQGNGYRTRTTPPPQPQAVYTPPQQMYDPYTGLPIGNGGTPPVAAGSGWAPGYEPPGAPIPGPRLGA
jgi:hypothetical protein